MNEHRQLLRLFLGKEVEEIVKARMRQYNEIKTKTTQVILPDPNSLTQHIKRASNQAYLLGAFYD